jgi:hypothetical protein
MPPKDRRAMDGPSDPCPGKREKRKKPTSSFIAGRRQRGGVLSLITLLCTSKESNPRRSAE